MSPNRNGRKDGFVRRPDGGGWGPGLGHQPPACCPMGKGGESGGRRGCSCILGVGSLAVNRYWEKNRDWFSVNKRGRVLL